MHLGINNFPSSIAMFTGTGPAEFGICDSQLFCIQRYGDRGAKLTYFYGIEFLKNSILDLKHAIYTK